MCNNICRRWRQERVRQQNFARKFEPTQRSEQRTYRHQIGAKNTLFLEEPWLSETLVNRSTEASLVITPHRVNFNCLNSTVKHYIYVLLLSWIPRRKTDYLDRKLALWHSPVAFSSSLSFFPFLPFPFLSHSLFSLGDEGRNWKRREVERVEER